MGLGHVTVPRFNRSAFTRADKRETVGMPSFLAYINTIFPGMLNEALTAEFRSGVMAISPANWLSMRKNAYDHAKHLMGVYRGWGALA
jgi:hypothetical protein